MGILSNEGTKDALQKLLLIYLCLAMTTLCIWTIREKNTVTGDEPHYLVLTSGIIKHGSFEQKKPYQDEFKSRKIHKFGLASPNTIPSPRNTHAIEGPHGLYNIHNIGLPLILSLPFLLAGVFGAKVFMVLLGGMGIVTVWCISGILSHNTNHRFLSTLATCVSVPLISGSNQIYPDILAGIIALSGIYWFMTTMKKRSNVQEGLWASLIVFLPWLQIKLSAPCFILITALILKTLFETNDKRRIIIITIAASFSFSTLAAYNHYAFGKYLGPYESEALQLSKTALMVLFGLHVDQNQGFLLQNPIMLIGLFSIGTLFFHNKAIALLWGLVFLSLIVPNAMHPNWYGGDSFSGRFGWSAEIVFALPTLFGLIRLAKIKPNLFLIIITLSLLLQAYFFSKYITGNLSLLNQNNTTWFSNYSLFYFPLHSWMPSLYNITWAPEYPPNYTWFGFFIILLVLGFCTPRNKNCFLPKHGPLILVFTVLAIIVSGFMIKKQAYVIQEIVFTGKELPSQTGQIQNTYRVASQPSDKPGYATFGPYLPLRKGAYQLILHYRSIAKLNQKIGTLDVFDSTKGAQLNAYSLYGTAGKVNILNFFFNPTNWSVDFFEFRNYWNGFANIQIRKIEFKRLTQ